MAQQTQVYILAVPLTRCKTRQVTYGSELGFLTFLEAAIIKVASSKDYAW